MNCTRRSFLKGSLATIFFSNFNVPLYGSIQNPKKNIVIISLRGGMDGLTAVPVNDSLIGKYRSDLVLKNNENQVTVNLLEFRIISRRALTPLPP